MKKLDVFIKSFVIGLIALSMVLCRPPEIGAPLKLTNINNSIVDYLKSNPSYSILLDALNLTGLSGTLNIYGQLTMFVPTNDAFNRFFASKGITGISGMNVDTLRNILRYHLYAHKFESGYFLTGSLPDVTVSGDLIKMDISQGLKNTVLNNTVKIDSLNIGVTNGVIHVIHDVLMPPVKTIYSFLSGNNDYSIMAEAIHRTGVDTAFLDKVIVDTTSIINGLPAKKWITAFIEPNSVLNMNGINSFNDLAKKYSNSFNTTQNYSSPSDSLNIFIRYHFMQKKFFVSDFRDDYLQTMSPDNWLIFDTQGGLNINKHDIWVGNNIVQYDVQLDLNNSNVVMSNGILHSIESVMSVYNPEPIFAKTYFAGAPEDRVITLLNGTVTTFSAQLSNLNNDPEGQSVVWWLKWGSTAGTMAIKAMRTVSTTLPRPYSLNPLYRYDFTDTHISNAPVPEYMDGLNWATGNKTVWFEITTKPIFKGKYTLYLYCQTLNSGLSTQNWRILWTFDGVRMADMINLMQNSKDAYGNDVRLVNNLQYDNQPGTNVTDDLGWLKYGYIQKRKLGVYTFDQIQSHKLRIDYVDDLNNAMEWLKIQFEPTK